ncbi:MAG: DUF1415 domain-containing protein [Burkholderiaceae bacterium]|jgi:hypothetical protein|nr:DUF1415 domain-containing protein [Burkholderiaceae bacterium]
MAGRRARGVNAAAPSADRAVALTRAWVNRVVIGLNLCPFAKAPQVKGRIRYVHSEAATPQALLQTLADELRFLTETPIETVETTLLIHPQTLTDFARYTDFTRQAEALVESLGLLGVLQIASFHPHYQFADAAPTDVTNATNRSPYPMLHLIREESIDRAVAAFPEAETIYKANKATMRKLGKQGVAALLLQCAQDADGG